MVTGNLSRDKIKQKLREVQIAQACTQFPTNLLRSRTGEFF